MDDLRLRSLAARDGDAVHEAILGDLKGVWSSLPAIIKTDSDGHTATAQSAVRMPVVQLDGKIKMVEYPDLDTSPVHYPGGGGVSHTHPVKKGDEGVVQFMSRAQDLWHQKGGVQDPVDNRSHHLADSRWIPGGRSDPRKLDPAPSKSSQQNRSDDGNHVMDVHPGNGITHASTVKHLVNVGGGNGAGTVHLPGKIIKNAANVLINSVSHPQLPPPGNTFANRKKVATIPVGAVGPQASAISSIMSSVMTGGIGTLMSNPIAAVGSSLSSAITSGAASITSALGGAGAGVVSALTGSGGMSDALGGLLTGASALSGATSPSVGAFGLSDVLSHAQDLTQFFGASVPTSVSLSSVLAPLSPATVSAVQTALAPTITAVVGGAMTPSAGVTAVNVLTSQINALMAAANTAITTLQTAKPALTLAQLAASIGFSLDANETAVSGAISNPNLAALSSAMVQLFVASAADSTAILSFPDTGQAGARGAF